jgi:hypothetical protein
MTMHETLPWDERRDNDERFWGAISATDFDLLTPPWNIETSAMLANNAADPFEN